MRIYLDASAAAKLFIAEAESTSLQVYLASHDDAEFLSSVLLETELRRTASAKNAPQDEASEVLSAIGLVEAPPALFRLAGLLPVPHLRSLDAIHLATALQTDVDALVTYDQRLISAAGLVGLATATPA